ncbi:type 4a pilus biogenesis protein PilO [Paenibacillus gallinarum]|uniref:Type 4a pilus biogenesis protein PilO n=1 Tax=Paenibacillus gallinarum TaxID=2762232 RepID=A0ABR8SX68_9BACL|nr:type 4a pilus biogenesis protein PilO [Paenibacillus gallinarum]MBD7967694.1 type 4a pilus biogenesis protein PilO [Paenibacillus gallinarum]
MERINKYRSVIVLALLLGFVLVFAFYWLGLSPTIDKLDEQGQELVQLEGEKQLLQNKLDEMKGNVEGQNSIDPEWDALPQNDMADQLILDIRAVNARSEATLKAIDFNLTQSNELHLMLNEEETMYPHIHEIKMNADLEGTLSQIESWMKELESLPRLMKVDSFALQHRSESGSMADPILTATLVFTSYYESAPK